MSLPARHLAPEPTPRKAPGPPTTHPRPRAVPTATPAARPQTSTPPQIRRWARRRHHTAFWLFSAASVSILIFGVVALNALLVQTTYRMQSVQHQVHDLADEQTILSDQVASLSSPARVAAWAHDHQMVMPELGALVVLSVPGTVQGAASHSGDGA